MTSSIYRGALIGCGYASWFQLTAWSRIEGVKIIALSSRTRGKAERRAAEFEVPAVYTDYRAMLDAESLDFVDIATPPVAHLEMVTQAARRGLHILCQKPIAPTLAQLRDMIRICDRVGVIFMVNENGRFQPWFRRIKSLLQENAIGRPYYANLTARARLSLPAAQFGGQLFLARMPRLIIYELGVHFLDTLRYLFGEATSVCAQTRQISPYVAGEDLATFIVQMGDVIAIADMSWASIPIREMQDGVSWAAVRIEGDKGTLHLRNDGLLRLITDDREEQCLFPPDSELLGYQNAQQHFIDCLQSGTEPETSGTETLKTMELVFGAYEAAKHNRVYRVGHDVDCLQ